MSLFRAWTALWICFMFGLKERPYSAHVLISFWCDSDNKNFDFFTFQNFSRYFSFVHFGYHYKYLQYAYWPYGICPVNFFGVFQLPQKNYQNLVIWLYSSNLIFCVCSVALRKKSGELFFFLQQNSRWPTNHMLLWRAWTAGPICCKEATYPGHMLIRFWCTYKFGDSTVFLYN